MLATILMALVLTTPADEAAVALALAQAGRGRSKSVEAVEAQPARPPAVAPAAPPAGPVSYREAERLVLSGRRVTLFVGRPATEVSTPATAVAYTESLPGFAAGVYDCFPDAGRAMFRDRATPAFATPVRTAAYQLFAPLRSTCPNGRCPNQ